MSVQDDIAAIAENWPFSLKGKVWRLQTGANAAVTGEVLDIVESRGNVRDDSEFWIEEFQQCLVFVRVEDGKIVIVPFDHIYHFWPAAGTPPFERA